MPKADKVVDIDYSIVGKDFAVDDDTTEVSVTFDVTKKVLDSMVEFTIQLIGPNNEDLGTRVVQQDIATIDVDNIDKVVRKMGRQAARAMYNSDDFQTKLKLAEKIDVPTPQEETVAVDLTEVTTKTDDLLAAQDILQDAVVALDTKNTETAQKLDTLATDVADIKRMIAEVNANQVTLSEWLAQIRTVLIS